MSAQHPSLVADQLFVAGYELLLKAAAPLVGLVSRVAIAVGDNGAAVVQDPVEEADGGGLVLA